MAEAGFKWMGTEFVEPLEGRRGAGENAGEIGVGQFPAGTYPSCSNHGAMVCVRGCDEDGDSLWRCLVEGCNIGLVWKAKIDTRHGVMHRPRGGRPRRKARHAA